MSESIKEAQERIAKIHDDEVEHVLDLVADSHGISRELVAEQTAKTAEKLGCDIDEAISRRWGVDINKRLQDKKAEALKEAARNYDPNWRWKMTAPDRVEPSRPKLGRAFQVNNDNDGM